MKLSVSLPDDDVATLDAYARAQGLKSRSAALQHAIRMLRYPHLDEDYAAAWDEWAAAGEEQAWSSAAADGLGDAPR